MSRNAQNGADPAGAVPPLPEGAPVTVCEVGPRDGFQIEREVIPTGRKVEIVEALFEAGVRHLQATSFVSPRAVPQLADAEELLRRIRRPAGAVVSALVPNLRGAERAAEAGVDAVHTVVSASETHNRKNVNRSRADSLAEFERVFERLDGSGIAVEGGMACAFGCPFEGEVPPGEVARIARRYQELGATRVGLGDTTGMAVPRTVRAAVEAIREAAPGLRIGLHFHNTRGVGLACVMEGLALGVDYYDASIGGLGGCPFAAGATGNISTEDLVYLLEEGGHPTGVSLDGIIRAAHLVEGVIGRELPGQVMKAGPRLRRHDAGDVATAEG